MQGTMMREVGGLDAREGGQNPADRSWSRGQSSNKIINHRITSVRNSYTRTYTTITQLHKGISIQHTHATGINQQFKKCQKIISKYWSCHSSQQKRKTKFATAETHRAGRGDPGADGGTVGTLKLWASRRRGRPVWEEADRGSSVHQENSARDAVLEVDQRAAGQQGGN